MKYKIGWDFITGKKVKNFVIYEFSKVSYTTYNNLMVLLFDVREWKYFYECVIAANVTLFFKIFFNPESN